MRRNIAALIALPLLSGCVGNGIAQRQAELATYVGTPEADLVRAFGVPARSFEVGGRRFLAYTERRLDVLPGGYGYGGLGYGYGPGRFGYYGAAYPTEVTERTCETTFELDAGKVIGSTLRGNAC
jgi:hypothetical protein